MPIIGQYRSQLPHMQISVLENMSPINPASVSIKGALFALMYIIMALDF